jgi:glucuronokinase
MLITSRVHARVGLVGNPSDGYNGCCISCLIDNFSAVVSLSPQSKGISFFKSPHDAHGIEYENLEKMSSQLEAKGYGGDGGVQLLQATTRQFYFYCLAHNIPLDGSSGFILTYSTNIPRQVGLSGSSAICTAALNCLMEHLSVKVPLEDRPQLIRAAETDQLKIVAGLQDRVVQVYGGMVWMDFSVTPHIYERLVNPNHHILDKMFIMYSEDLSSDSGKIHSDVKRRWEEGEEVVKEGMRELAGLARECKDLLKEGCELSLEQAIRQLGKLINRNFDIRRQLFGDHALGKKNLLMIQLARLHGAAAKMTGSGGCVLVLDLEDKSQILNQEAEREGFTLSPIRLP